MRRVHERGTTMVETALVMSVLLLVLFGIMDFGRLLYTYHMVENAARIGARFAIVRGAACQHYVSGSGDTWPCPASVSDVQNYVSQQSLLMGLGPIPTSDISANWSFVQGCAQPSGVVAIRNQRGCQVAVTVNYSYNFMLPGMPGTIPISSTSKMLISQ